MDRAIHILERIFSDANPLSRLLNLPGVSFRGPTPFVGPRNDGQRLFSGLLGVTVAGPGGAFAGKNACATE